MGKDKGLVRTGTYKNPSLLVLDEATSALDVKTEDWFYLTQNYADLTIITVSHRLILCGF